MAGGQQYVRGWDGVNGTRWVRCVWCSESDVRAAGAVSICVCFVVLSPPSQLWISSMRSHCQCGWACAAVSLA